MPRGKSKTKTKTPKKQTRTSRSSRKKRPYLLLVGESLGLGGAEKVTVDLANALHNSGKVRVGVLLTLSENGLFADRLHKDVKVMALQDGEAEALYSRIAVEKPDGVLFNNCRFASRDPESLLRRSKPSYLGYFVHGYSRWSMDLLPEVFPDDAHVLTISNEAAMGIRRLRGDIVHDAVSVLPNAVDTERFRPHDSTTEDLAWEVGEGPVFGYCGRFSGEKSLITMVDCFRRIKARLPRAKLLLVGGSDPGVAIHDAYWSAERRTVEQVIRQMDLVNDVRITGAVKDTENYYRMMDVFLLTSQFEGLPLVLLEAMASGLPVVSTAVGAVPDMLECGCGVAVAKVGPDMSDVERDFFAMKMVEMAEAENRKELGLKGRRMVEQAYSMDRYGKLAVDYFTKRLGC